MTRYLVQSEDASIEVGSEMWIGRDERHDKEYRKR